MMGNRFYRKIGLISLFLVILTLSVYRQTNHHEFINYDEALRILYVTANLPRKGKIEEVHFREALRIKPGDAGAMNNLKKGMALQRTDK